MTGNKEVITGSDFKRMVTGAYSEFLLEYENINVLAKESRPGYTGTPGTNILRTMGAAVMPLADTRDESIGGLARRVAAAAVLGARGNSGVVLAQIFRGLAKGLIGKHNATSSEFGKAFQYGILYAQRVIPEKPERPIITAAKAVAKGAYHAVRANLPISEILDTAIGAGTQSIEAMQKADAGARIMIVFLQGCLKGLDGNFVSPTLSFSLGRRVEQDLLPDPRKDLVRPYCLTFTVKNAKADVEEIEKFLREYGKFVLVERTGQTFSVHLHTDHPGQVIEQAVGWGALRDVRISNMAEPHAMALTNTFMSVALLAVAETADQAEHLQELGATVIVTGSSDAGPSVSDFVNAAHSDIASSYVMAAGSRAVRLVMQQVKRILGNRVELVLADDAAGQEAALAAFDGKLTAKENARVMQQVFND